MVQSAAQSSDLDILQERVANIGEYLAAREAAAKARQGEQKPPNHKPQQDSKDNRENKVADKPSIRQQLASGRTKPQREQPAKTRQKTQGLEVG